MNYTCGLLFSHDFKRIALVEREDGKLSGIEGRWDSDLGERRARDTMARACKDRLTIDIEPEAWSLFAEFLIPKTTSGDRWVFFFATTMFIEAVTSYTIADVIDSLDPMLRLLIHAAIEWRNLEVDSLIMIHESARRRARDRKSKQLHL